MTYFVNNQKWFFDYKSGYAFKLFKDRRRFLFNFCSLNSFILNKLWGSESDDQSAGNTSKLNCCWPLAQYQCTVDKQTVSLPPANNTCSSKLKMAKCSNLNGSQIFSPFRALGFISNGIPLALQSLGKEVFVATVVGRSYHLYSVSILSKFYLSVVTC